MVKKETTSAIRACSAEQKVRWEGFDGFAARNQSHHLFFGSRVRQLYISFLFCPPPTFLSRLLAETPSHPGQNQSFPLPSPRR